MSRLPEGVVVAIIAAVSALAGTVVGAAVSYVGNQRLQEREVAQEEARQTTAARAVARILSSEYLAEYLRVRGMLAEREYDPTAYRERSFISHVGLEDRKLLAGRLTENAWMAVSGASRAVEEVEGDLEDHRGEGRVGEEEEATLARARTDCLAAYEALTPLANGKAVT
ncbi:MAG TPA: hypothetical protein VK790_08750 [Solirubrobacteraceae bacterium]|jgi:hypothetical protein|nr:hypothetical protein [Solirubrobacteraceae bacterium]